MYCIASIDAPTRFFLRANNGLFSTAKLQANLATQTRDVRTIRENLDRIGVAFLHFRSPKSSALVLVPVAQELWPLLSAYLKQFVHEPSVLQKVTKCLLYIMASLEAR